MSKTPRTDAFLAEHSTGFGMGPFCRTLERENTELRGFVRHLAQFDVMRDPHCEICKRIRADNPQPADPSESKG